MPILSCFLLIFIAMFFPSLVVAFIQIFFDGLSGGFLTNITQNLGNSVQSSADQIARANAPFNIICNLANILASIGVMW